MCSVYYVSFQPILILILALDVTVAGIDIQDDMGRHEVGMKDNTNKIPQFEENGCRLESYFTINKVLYLI